MEQIISKLVSLHNEANSSRNFALSYNGNVNKSTHYQFVAEGIRTCIYYLGYKPVMNPNGDIAETVKMMDPDYMGLLEYYMSTKETVRTFLTGSENLLNIKSGVLCGIYKCIELVGSDKFDNYYMFATKESSEDSDDELFEDDEHIITVVEEEE